jgi:hypothetical protein
MHVNSKLYKINENSPYVYLAHILAFFFFLIRKSKEHYRNTLIFIKIQLGLHKIEYPPIDPIEEYIKKNKNKLLRTWENESANSKINSNIDPIFYNKKELNEIMKIEHNHIEKSWKTRILYESTPRGSIIMFYDAFKQGFSYYSEQNGIPYSILNAVAMKYVVMFFCRDFFMDEQTIIPPAMVADTEQPDKEDNIEYINPKLSPLIKVYYEEEKKEKSTTEDEKKTEADKETKKQLLQQLKDAPFAKLKNYKLATNPASNPTNTDQDEKPIKQLLKNKFISLGKIRDFNIIQKPPKQTCMPIVGTSFDGLFGVPTTNTSKSTTSYKDYKQKKITYKDYKLHSSKK